MFKNYLEHNFLYFVILIALLTFCFLVFGVDAHAYTEEKQVYYSNHNAWADTDNEDPETQYRFFTQSFFTSATGTNISDVYVYLDKSVGECSWEDANSTMYFWICAGHPDAGITGKTEYLQGKSEHIADYTPCYNYTQPLIATSVPISNLGTASGFYKLWDDALIDTLAETEYYINGVWTENGYYTTSCMTFAYGASVYSGYADYLGVNYDYALSIYKAVEYAGGGSFATSTTLTWVNPKNGYILNNSAWNDWNVAYDLVVEDTFYDWMMMSIEWQDSMHRSVDDLGVVEITTAPTTAIINRSTNPKDGQVFATAKLWGMASSTTCQPDTTLLVGDCNMTLIAESETIEFTASSSSTFDIGDWQPVDGPTFVKATTTTDTSDGLIEKFWNVISTRMFPFSIINQLQDAVKIAVSRKGGSPTIDLRTFIADQYDSYVGSSAFIFSSTIITSNVDKWYVIRTGIGNFVYFINFFIIIGLVFKFKKYLV